MIGIESIHGALISSIWRVVPLRGTYVDPRLIGLEIHEALAVFYF